MTLLAEARASSELSLARRERVSWRTNSSCSTSWRLTSTLSPKRRRGGWSRRTNASAMLVDRRRFQVVYPVLPMDLMGIYVLLPE
jgi:hypothetical protein